MRFLFIVILIVIIGVMTMPSKTINSSTDQQNVRLVGSGTIDTPSASVATLDSEDQQYTIYHGLGYTPIFMMYAYIPSAGSQAVSSFPANYYVPLPPIFTYAESGTGSGLQYTYAVGGDETNLYFVRSIFNGSASTQTAQAGTMKYYIYASVAD